MSFLVLMGKPQREAQSKMFFNSSRFAKVHNVIDPDLLLQAGDVDCTEISEDILE